MNNRLNILWTNADPVTAELMVFMYGINAQPKGWWDEVTIIIWGATTKLVAENKHIQKLVKEAQQKGVHVSACLSCAKALEKEQEINDLGIELKLWGPPLTEIIKNKEHLITI